MATRRAMEIAVVLLGLLAMVQSSMSLPLKPRAQFPLYENPALGLITVSSSAAKQLLNSSQFIITEIDYVFGRTVYVGTIYETPVVFVKVVASPSINVGITCQLLARYYNLHGFIHFGSVGATNETLDIGDVVIPSYTYWTGNWEWLSRDSNSTGELVIGKFNWPIRGKKKNNLLGSIEFEESYVYHNGKVSERSYIHSSKVYLTAAAQISLTEVNVVLGLNASSSDILVYNPAYREFVYMELGLSTVDTSSAAVALAAKSNGLKYITLGGVSNKAGAGDGSTDSALAATNVVKAVICLIGHLSLETQLMVN